jgi:hypothetical protein
VVGIPIVDVDGKKVAERLAITFCISEIVVNSMFSGQ